MRTIYVDMDGVLFDFEEGLRRVSGGKGLAEVGDENLWEVIRPHSDGFYATLPLMADALVLWEFLHANNYPNPRIQILTALPRRANFPTSERDKRMAVVKHFGPEVIMNIGPYAVDKQNWCKPGDILIDDSEKNIPQWESKGGIGILHTSSADTISQLKLRVSRGGL